VFVVCCCFYLFIILTFVKKNRHPCIFLDFCFFKVKVKIGRKSKKFADRGVKKHYPSNDRLQGDDFGVL
jgi:hypothetical protein